MESTNHDSRELGAARNQALFRLVNEKMRELNGAMAALTETFAIACECADLDCLELIEIAPSDYDAVRAEPRQFVVWTGHVYPEIETVVRAAEGYVVVEKFGTAGEAAETLVPEAMKKT
jgi:hypothetical protein